MLALYDMVFTALAFDKFVKHKDACVLKVHVIISAGPYAPDLSQRQHIYMYIGYIGYIGY